MRTSRHLGASRLVSAQSNVEFIESLISSRSRAPPFTQDPPREIDKAAKVAPAWNRLDADNFVVPNPWNAFQSMLI
jgi:hypothetical protein